MSDTCHLPPYFTPFGSIQTDILSLNRKAKKLSKAEIKKRKETAEKREKRRLKRLLKTRDHTKPQFDDKEKKLTKIATRGVVALFNAVEKQQRALRKSEGPMAVLGLKKAKGMYCR